MKPTKLFILALVVFALFACQSGKEAARPPVRLDPEVKRLAEEVLTPLEEPVTIRIFRGGEGETSGEEAQALVDLVAGVSPMVSVEKLDILSDPGAKDLGVPHGPVIEMKGKAPGTLRYYGFPERKEIRPFFEGILSASAYPAKLAPRVETYLVGLDEEVWIRIFTTPD